MNTTQATAALTTLRDGAWFNTADMDYFDYDSHPVTLEDNSLAVVYALFDCRDAVYGWGTHRAPAAQQYGYRLRRSLEDRRIAAVAAAEAEAAVVEPF
ncbi:MAG: hypothetical protein ACRDXE_10750 [Acidimicrobiales bacterium]